MGSNAFYNNLSTSFSIGSTIDVASAQVGVDQFELEPDSFIELNGEFYRLNYENIIHIVDEEDYESKEATLELLEDPNILNDIKFSKSEIEKGNYRLWHNISQDE